MMETNMYKYAKTIKTKSDFDHFMKMLISDLQSNNQRMGK